MTALYLSSGFWIVIGPLLLGLIVGYLIGRRTRR